MVNEHSLNNGDYYQNGFTETSKLTTFAQVSDTILRHFGLKNPFLTYPLTVTEYFVAVKYQTDTGHNSDISVGTQITSQNIGEI